MRCYCSCAQKPAEQNFNASNYAGTVKAIAPAFRWREMLKNGTHATIAEIAAAEKINESYVGRVLRLTLLAPDIVEAILGGRQPAEMTLGVLMQPFSVMWGGAAEDKFLLDTTQTLGLRPSLTPT